MSQNNQIPTIPFSALQKNLIPSVRSDPFPQSGSKDRAQFLRPPPIIPLSSIPPSLFSPSFSSLPGTSSLNNGIPTLKPNSWPQTMAFPQRREDQQQLFMNQAALLNGGLQRQQFMMNVNNLSRTSSPEEREDARDSRDEGSNEGGGGGGGDTRNNRRREMNRLAQQKSRLRKDQLRATLQNENDALKAKIISLEAEVRVWKNMTKKSENEANELRRKIEEYELGIKGQTECEVKSNGRPRSISNERLTIVEEPEDHEGEVPMEQTAEAEGIKTDAVEANMATKKKMDDMQKEIELLTNEIQRMYHLCTKQAETQKMLSQALEDQQLRIKQERLDNKKNEKVENLEMSSVSAESVAPVVQKLKIKWNGRAPRRGISKREKMDLLKKVTKLVKQNKDEA